MSKFKAVTVFLIITFPISAMAQTLPTPEETETTYQSVSNSLRGKHSIQVNAGLLTEMNVSTEVSEGDVTVNIEEPGNLLFRGR